MRTLPEGTLPRPAMDAISSFLSRITVQDRARIERVVLFGSAARGTMTGESDVDLLIVWQGPIEDAYDRLIRAATEVLVETGIDLSIHPFSPQAMNDIERMRTGFFENIQRDGFVVA